MLDTFENEKLKHLKTSRRPLDVIEGAENLPDPTDAGQGNTPKKMSGLSKRNLTPETTAATKRCEYFICPELLIFMLVNSKFKCWNEHNCRSLIRKYL